MTNSVFTIWVLLAFGVVGYAFKKLGMPLAPFALTFILGQLLEKALRRTLEMSQGDLSIFVERPLSAGIMVIGVLGVALAGAMHARRWRQVLRA